jgi:hypothetical protein
MKESVSRIVNWLPALFLGFALLAWFPAASAQPAREEAEAQKSEARTNPAPPVSTISPGIFKVGSVTLNRTERTVAFPSVLNTNAGPMEYLLVHSQGKVHESILQTATEPYHIHVAMLLLGAGGTNQLGIGGGTVPSGPIEQPSAEKLPGDKISITVSWNVEGRVINVPASELVYNLEKKEALNNADWVYNGSRMISGRFIGQIEGSVISLITDPGALINNVGPGHENDQIWTANTNRLPPVAVPVEVKLKLENPPNSR